MLLLKVWSVCVGMEVFGESTAVALEVAQVTPTQLGNVCLRQYLSSRSLGKTSDANNAIKVETEQTVGQQWNECRWCVYLEFIIFLNLVFFDSSSQLKSEKVEAYLYKYKFDTSTWVALCGS